MVRITAYLSDITSIARVFVCAIGVYCIQRPYRTDDKGPGSYTCSSRSRCQRTSCIPAQVNALALRAHIDNGAAFGVRLYNVGGRSNADFSSAASFTTGIPFTSANGGAAITSSNCVTNASYIREPRGYRAPAHQRAIHTRP